MKSYKSIVSPLLIFLIQCSESAHTDNENTEELFYKLTPTFLANSNNTNGTDLNLRANAGPIITSLGYYKGPEHFKQVRAGYEYRLDAHLGHIKPSVQIASKGFTNLAINH
jgi:hypothetical protein